MTTMVAISVSPPSEVLPAYFNVLTLTKREPGCWSCCQLDDDAQCRNHNCVPLTVTQPLMLISESVIPSLLTMALLVSLCPMYDTKT